MYPKDAITISHEITGIGNYTFYNLPASTILGVGGTQSGTQSESTILCAGVPLTRNYAQNLPFQLLNKTCSGAVVFDKTGAGDTAFITLTYVPYFTASTTASTTPYFVNGISYGDLLTSTLLFFILSGFFIKFLLDRLVGVKEKRPFRRFLGNNSMDGKEIIEF